tara:strand:- start:73 stop:714 length:642 start_codon:yes stop_codon:yes gene_type:complete
MPSDGEILVPSAEARRNMARTIVRNTEKVGLFTEYPDCRFEEEDDDGRVVVWEMRRRARRSDGCPGGWRFYVPTEKGCRNKEVGLHTQHWVQYLIASDAELGPRTKLTALDALHKAHPHRSLDDAMPVVATPAAAEPAAADAASLSEILPEANGVLAEGADAGALHVIAVPADQDLDTPAVLYGAVQRHDAAFLVGALADSDGVNVGILPTAP